MSAFVLIISSIISTHIGGCVNSKKRAHEVLRYGFLSTLSDKNSLIFIDSYLIRYTSKTIFKLI